MLICLVIFFSCACYFVLVFCTQWGYDLIIQDEAIKPKPQKRRNKMNMKDSLKIAKKVAADRADVSAHYGTDKRKDRAVRITGCFANEARDVAHDIAEAINGTVAAQAGFVCVWL